MRPWMFTLLFLAVPAFAADVGYFSWQERGHGSIICAPSNKRQGTLGDCERPGPKDLTELYCDSKFVKGSGREGKLGARWQAACRKYEKSGRHEIVRRRSPKYYAWQQGADRIQCKEVPKGFGTPGKCVYPGPKNFKELICNDGFFRYSGERVDQDAFCHRHPWQPPVRTADDAEEDAGDDAAAASAADDGGGEMVMPNPAADRGDSDVSVELQ